MKHKSYELWTIKPHFVESKVYIEMYLCGLVSADSEERRHTNNWSVGVVTH